MGNASGKRDPEREHEINQRLKQRMRDITRRQLVREKYAYKKGAMDVKRALIKDTIRRESINRGNTNMPRRNSMRTPRSVPWL
jgi:hypothetical protein